jgi:peptide/nickel transport system substrate-binding protein
LVKDHITEKKPDNILRNEIFSDFYYKGGIIMKRNHCFYLLTVVFLLTSLFSATSVFGASGKVTIAQGAEPRALDCHKGGSTMFINTTMTMFDTLYRRDYEGELQPHLAASYKNIDGRTWEFSIHEGVSFHNGEALTAEDVKFSLDRARDPETKFPMRVHLGSIESVEVVDDHTVRVITKKSDPTLLTRLAHCGFIAPKDYIEEKGDEYFGKHPVGSGRYEFVEWAQNDYIEVKANDNYWGQNPPSVETLIFKVIPENGARMAALQTGEVDIATNILPFMADKLKKDKNIEVVSGPSGRVIFIGMNLLDEEKAGPLMNPKVRQALNYAVDVPSLIKNVLMGSARQLATPLIPQAFGYDPSIEPYPYDPEKAKELLAEAGYPDGFSTEFDTGSGRYLMDKQVAEAITGMLGDVGVDVKLNVLEWGQYVSTRRAHTVAPLYLLGWGNTRYDADGTLAPLFCIDCTHSNYHNPELWNLIEEARYEMDKEKRKEIYSEALRMIKKEAPWIFLYEQKDHYGVRSRVGNFHKSSGSELMFCDTLTIQDEVFRPSGHNDRGRPGWKRGVLDIPSRQMHPFFGEYYENDYRQRIRLDWRRRG